MVHRFEGAGQQEHRDVPEAGRPFDVLGHFVPGTTGHARVHEHDIRRTGVDSGNRLVTVAHGDHLDVLVGESELDHTLNREAVVGKKKGLSHLGLIGSNRLDEQVCLH
jgi:hypothetical protein